MIRSTTAQAMGMLPRCQRRFLATRPPKMLNLTPCWQQTSTFSTSRGPSRPSLQQVRAEGAASLYPEEHHACSAAVNFMACMPHEQQLA